MVAGGKRKGAGRPESGKDTVWFRFQDETIRLLRDLVPAYERSAYVEGVLLKALREKQERDKRQTHKTK